MSPFSKTGRSSRARLVYMDNDAQAEAMQSSSTLAADVIAGTKPDQHVAPTPCPDFTVADVINHLAFGFEMARRSGEREDWDPGWKPDSTAPALDGVPAAEWASVCGCEAPRTAQAWSDPQAWEGESTMGSSAMPAAMVGAMMTAEFVVHGWDLAVATGQPYEPSAEAVQAAIAGVEPMLDMGRDGGWYGAEVRVEDSAPAAPAAGTRRPRPLLEPAAELGWRGRSQVDHRNCGGFSRPDGPRSLNFPMINFGAG